MLNLSLASLPASGNGARCGNYTLVVDPYSPGAMEIVVRAQRYDTWLTCTGLQAVSDVTAFIDTPVACPAGGPWSSSAGNCDFRRSDNGTTKVCHGNPCNPATGAKFETIVDYEAPGIRFARTWRSNPAVETAYAGSSTPFLGTTPQAQAVLPWGWTHSYAMKVIFSGTTLKALFRPDGAVVGVQETSSGSGIYVAIDGSGIQARGSSTSDVTVYLPDGSTELYDYITCSGFLYVPGHRLDHVVDAAGRVTQLEFSSACDVNSPPTRIVGPFGHELQIAYNTTSGTPRPFINHLTDSAGETISFGYTTKTVSPYSDVLLTTATYQDGGVFEYLYEDTSAVNRRLLTGFIDERSIEYASFSYDSVGRATSTQRAGGYKAWTFTYNGNGTTTATDANSLATVYAFQSASRPNVLASATRSGATSSETNETSGQFRLLTKTDERGVTTSFGYNTYHMTSMTEAYGAMDVTPRTTSYSHLNDTSRLLTEAESPSACYDGTPRLKSTESQYLSSTQLVSEVTENGWALDASTGDCEPIARTTAYEYGTSMSFARTYGLPTLIEGPQVGVADDLSISYYECTTGAECGQVATIENAAGHEWTFDTYDDHGHVTQITTPTGVVDTFTYDLRGRVESRVETSGAVNRTTSYDYYDNGLLQRITKPDGAYLEFTYNDARLLTDVVDNDGNKISYAYDLAENRTNEDVYDASLNLKKTVELAYDNFNHLESITAPGSVTALVFDAVGNLTDETDPNSNDTGHSYDSLNRLTDTLDALSGATALGYDANDALVSVEAPNGATTTSVYDDLGNVLSATSPDTGTTTYTYDAAGNRLTQTDANSVTVDYAYDALNRVTSIEYPNSSLDVTLEYDQGTHQEGRLTTMTDGSGVTAFAYDVFGNLTSESKAIDGHTHVTSYTYGAADLVESITYPSGRTVDYTRNALGQITAVDTTYAAVTTTVADDAAYEPFGPLSSLTFGNSLVMSRTFDQQYRLTAQTTGAVQDLGLTLDAAGNIDAIADGVHASLDQTFTQDALHRIDSEAGAYGSNDYTYDENGNRLTRVHTSGGVTTQTLTYASDSNRLATHDGLTVSLDAAGNTTADPAETLSFTYDDHHRMVAAYVGAVLKASYVYNGQGQRVKKVEATGAQRTVVYHYGIDGRMLGETIYSSGGAKIGERDYLWLEALPIAQSERTFSGGTITSSQFVYIHADQLNTPRLATNGAGTVVWRWDSDAFGVGDADDDPDADTNPVNIRLRFPGQYLDEETGLAYNYFRDYDAVTGRYLQSDPIGLAGGLSTYSYGVANPVTQTDPAGLAPRDLFNTREDAGADMADYASAIAAHNRSWLTWLLGDHFHPWIYYYEDETTCGYYWDRLIINVGYPPDLLGPRLKLWKQLSSEEGAAQLVAGGGRAIAGAGTTAGINDIVRLVKTYGGHPAQWAKVTSTIEGRIQTRAYRNVITGELVELKSVLR